MDRRQSPYKNTQTRWAQIGLEREKAPPVACWSAGLSESASVPFSHLSHLHTTKWGDGRGWEKDFNRDVLYYWKNCILGMCVVLYTVTDHWERSGWGWPELEWAVCFLLALKCEYPVLKCENQLKTNLTIFSPINTRLASQSMRRDR